MIDLENLPQPNTFKLEDFPGINSDLIREKFAEGNIEYLIRLFDFIQRSKHRAESLAQVYFNQMEILHKRLNEARGESDLQPHSKSKSNSQPTGAKKSDSSLALDL